MKIVKNCFELIMFLLILGQIEILKMKMLYLKGYKWLLSQNQRARIDFLGYRRYEAQATHIKSFFKKKQVLKVTESTPRLLRRRWPFHSLEAAVMRDM